MKGNTILLCAVFVCAIILKHGSCQENYCYYDGQTNLAYQRMYTGETFVNGSYDYITGTLEICQNNTLLHVCGDSSYQIDRMEVARLACNDRGYYDGYSVNTTEGLSNNALIINYINCSQYSYHLSNCDIDVTASADCTVASGLLQVTCRQFTQSPTYCSNEGDTTLTNISSFSYPNLLGEVVTGIPQVCINNNYTPLCSSNITQRIADSICRSYTGASQSQGILYPIFDGYSSYISTQLSRAADLNCPSNFSLIGNDCSPSVLSSCPIGDNGVISCFSRNMQCYSGGVQRASSRSESYPFKYSESFRPQICDANNDQYIDICTDNLNVSRAAELFCSYFGYSLSSVSSDESLRGADTNRLYATNFSCPYDYVGSSCNFNVSSTCSGTPLVVECRRTCNEGYARIVNGVPTQLSNGSQAYTGILEVCNNGQWASICYNGSNLTQNTQDAIRRACSGLGYTGGSILQYSPIFGMSETDVVYEGVTCPSYVYTFGDCSFTESNTSTCVSHQSDAIIQCIALNDSCYSSNDVSFHTRTTISFPNGTRLEIGYPTICSYNYTQSAVCSNPVTPYDADILCRNAGFQLGYNYLLYGDSMDYLPFLTHQGVYNYTCPSNVSYLSSCQFNFTDNGGCQNHSNAGLITCQRNPCSGNSVRLNNRGSGYFNNGSSYYIGQPEICLNGFYAPVCRSALSPIVVEALCYNEGYVSGVYVYSYPITGHYDNYTSTSPSNRVITSINCTNPYSSYYNCDYNGLTTANNNTCNGGNAVITCTNIYTSPAVSPTPPTPPSNQCNATGQYRLSNTFSQSSGIVENLLGYLEICVNGTYYRVCGNSSFATIDSDVPALACSGLGYSLSELHTFATFMQSSAIINSISCPNNATNISSCNFGLNNSTGICTNHTYDTILSCGRIRSSCTESSIMLGYNYTTVSNGTTYTIGVPQACITGVYTEICNDETVSSFIPSLICRSLGYQDGISYPFNGSLIGYTPLHSFQYVTNLTCPSNVANILDCNGTFSGNCSADQQGYAVLCTRPYVAPSCVTGSVRFYSNYTYSNYSTDQYIEQILGYIQICVNGQYHSLCSEFNATSIVASACNQLGYYSGSSYYSSYTSTVNASINYISCPYTGAPLSSCFYNINSSCSSYNNRVYATCTRSSPVSPTPPTPPSTQCNATGQYRLSNTFAQSSGIVEHLLGYLEICVNGTYYRVCGNSTFATIDSDVPALACSGLGYSLSELHTSATFIQSSAIINSISCPNNAINISSCNFGLNNSTGVCTNHYYDTILSCGRIRSSCTERSIMLSYNYTFVSNGTTYTIGVPQACITGVYAEICNDETVSSLIPSLTCRSLGYQDGISYPFNGSLIGYTPLHSFQYLTNLTCPSNVTNILDCNGTFSGNCSADQQGYAVLCTRPYVAPSCVTGSVRFYSNYTNSYYSTDQYIEQFRGYIQICVNGQYHSLCGEFNATSAVASACNQLGYYSSSYYSSYTSIVNDSINNIICPYTGAPLSSCFYNVNSSCSLNNYRVYAICTRSTPSCRGLYSVRNASSFTFTNGTAISTGRVEVCINDSYRPLCPNNLNNPDFICNNALGTNYQHFPGQYILNPYDYYTYGNGVVSNLTCPPEAYDVTSCNYTLGSYCPLYDEAVISCISYSTPSQPTCYNGTTSLANGTQYNSLYGASFSLGRVETCYNNQMVDICSDTSYPDYFARSACNGQNYTIIPYDNAYSSAPSNLHVVISNCSDGISYYSSWFQSCNWTIRAGPCLTTPLAVRCDSDCNSHGLIRLVQTTVDYYSNGTAGITGNAEFCNSGRWNSICPGSLRANDTTAFCQQLGYSNGTLLSVNPGGTNNNNLYANLSCPDYDYFSFVSCSVNYQNQNCTNRTVIHCYDETRESCYEGQFQYSNGRYGSNPISGRLPNGSYYTIGSIEVCINGTYHDICNNSITQQQAQLYCRQISSLNTIAYPYALFTENGYSQTPSFDYNSNGLYNVNCPSNLSYLYLSSCAYNITSGNGCSNHGGPAVITCIEGAPTQPSCSNNDIAFADFGYGTFFNGTSFSIGRPQYCINNTLAPICSSLSYNAAYTICSHRGDYGARASPIIGSLADFGVDNSSNIIVNNLTCPNGSNYISECSFGSSPSPSGCGNDDAVITCINLPQITTCPQFSTRVNYFDYNYSGSNSITFTISVSVCIDGSYGDLCADSITDSIANSICVANGATYGSIARDYNRTYSLESTLYANLTCPEYASSFSSCNGGDAISVPSCNGYGGLSAIRCTITQPICFTGQTALDNPVNYTINGTSYVSGRPVVCVNGSLHPICESTPLGSDFITPLCQISGYPSGYSGPPPGSVSIPQLSNITNTSLAVSSIQCSGFYNCTNINTTRNCSSNNYATVTCTRACVPGTSTLLYNYTTVINGTNYTIGVPQSCLFGSYAEVCNDGTNSPTFPTSACRLYGFQDGFFYPFNTSNSNLIPGTSYYSNFSCPSYPTSIFDCIAAPSTNPNCSTGQLRYSIACYGTLILPTSTFSPMTSTVYFNVSSSISTSVLMTTITNFTSTFITPTSTYATILPTATTTASTFISTSIATTSTSIATASTSFATASTSFATASTSIATTSTSFATSATVSVTPTPTPSCYVNDGRFGDRASFRFGNGAQYYTGRPEVCTNYGYIPVCRAGLSESFVEGFCGYNNYGSEPVDDIAIGTLDDYLSNYTTRYAVINATCPSIDSLYNCIYQTAETNCSEYGGLAVFSCYSAPQPQTECSGNSFSLQNVTDVTYYTNKESFSGRLTACLNNEYVDICADNINNISSFASTVCYNRYYTDSFSYSYSTWSVQDGVSNSGRVLTNVNCSNLDYGLSYCSYNTTTIDQCSSGLIRIQCTRECNNNDVRITDQQAFDTPEGRSAIRGRLEVCVNYRWVSVCDNGSLTNTLANISCRSFGYDVNRGYDRYSDGVFIRGNNTLSGANETFYTGFSCSNNSYSVYDCTPNGLYRTNSSQCSYAIVQCHRSTNCMDYYDLSFNSRISINYDTYGLAGRPEFCYNNQRTTFCNSSLDISIATRLCSISSSYASTALPYPLTGNAQDYGIDNVRNYVTHLSCPLDGYGINGCNITTADTCDGPTSIITCFQSSFTCSLYQAQISDGGSGSFDNDYTRNFGTGYAEVCNGTSYIPICRNGITDEELRYICSQRGYYGLTIGPVVGIPSNYTPPMADTVAINVTCPVFSRYDGCRFTTGDTCNNDGGLVLFTCSNIQRMCNHGDVRIAGGPNNYTGRPEFCYFGTWRTICGTGFDQRAAAVTCQLAGFNHDRAINVSAGMYGGNGFLPVLAGLRCATGREGSFSNCTPINGDLLSSCNISAAVYCEPLIVSMNTTVNGTAVYGSPTDAYITCNANYDQISLDNVTLTSFNWYRNGEQLTDVMNRYNITRSYLRGRRCFYNDTGYYTCANKTVGVSLVLRFNTLHLTDGGEYTCIVNVTDTNYSRTIVNTTSVTFDLQVPVEIQDQPNNVTTLTNNNVTFTCSILSNPSPMIRWYYIGSDGLPIPVDNNDGQYSILVSSDVDAYRHTSTLSINNAALTNTGIYRCSATNTFSGPVTSSALLTVFVSPTVTVSGMSSLVEGESLTLTCRAANSYPLLPYVTWSRNGQLVLPSTTLTISHVNTFNTDGTYTTTSTLTISSTRPIDSGNYLCITPSIPLSSPVLPSLSDSFNVIVENKNECLIVQEPCLNGATCIDLVDDYFCQCPAGFVGIRCEISSPVPIPPSIVISPLDQNVNLGNLVNLSCIATGSPQPALTWFKDGEIIAGANVPFYIIQSIEPKNRGEYYCTASNSEGSDKSSIAYVTIRDIRQYSTLLTIDSARSRRQDDPLESLIASTRMQYIGAELSPGVIVADIELVADPPLGFQLIFTLRVASTDTGDLVSTGGVTDSLNGVLTEVAMQSPNIEFTPVVRFDGCLSESYNVNDDQSITWPEVSIDVSVRLVCPCGNITTDIGFTATRRCTGNYTTAGQWGTANVSSCDFDVSTIELCELSTVDNDTEIAVLLLGATTLVDSTGFSVSSLLLNDLISSAANDDDILDGFIAIVNNLIDIDPSTIRSSQQQSGGPQQILNAVDELVGIANTNQFIGSSFGVRALSINSTSAGWTMSDRDILSSLPAAANTFNVPDTLLSEAAISGNNARLAFGLYLNDKLYSTDQDVTVSSSVMTLNLYHENGSLVTVQNLNNPITLTFNQPSSAGLRFTCASWDVSTLTWSSNGLTTSVSDSTVTCYSSHLSSFVVLSEMLPSPSPTMSATPTVTVVTTPTPTSAPSRPAEIIIVGLVVSLVFIGLTIISHLISSSQRHCPEGRIFISSNITLFILYIIMIIATGASYTNSLEFCGIFAGFLHLFTMIYFGWLLIEAIFYFVKLQFGVGTNPFTRYYFTIMLLVNIVVSIVIVVISVAPGYSYFAEITEMSIYCRPQNYPFYFGYVIPVGVIFIACVIFYFINLIMIYCTGMTTSEKKHRKDSVIIHVYVGLLLLSVFGIIWALFMVGSQNTLSGPGITAAQYLFGFGLMAHSVLSFIMCLVRTPDTRSAWLSCCRGRRGKYDIATPRVVAQQENIYGLDTSGQYMTDKEDSPLKEKEGIPEVRTTSMIGGPDESTVVTNEEAIADESHEDEKKTDF